MSATTSPLLEEGDFAAGRCKFCEREVITYPDGDAAAPRARRCIHCDERIVGELRWVDVADLEALGYDVDSGEERGGGCTSCTSGGCASPSVKERRGT